MILQAIKAEDSFMGMNANSTLPPVVGQEVSVTKAEETGYTPSPLTTLSRAPSKSDNGITSA